MANEKMHVIGCIHVVEYASSVTLLGPEPPVQIDCAVTYKLEHEFALVAPTGNVSDVVRQEIAVGARGIAIDLLELELRP